MSSLPHNLTVIDGETLIDKRLTPTKFCVDTLIPQGINILGGSPKVGKSWFVLDLCVRVAKGEPIWNLNMSKGEVLYLCLEDTERRIQERLNLITDDIPEGMYFATGTTSIENGVCAFIRDFKSTHPDVSLVAIDTFQLIRSATNEVSYGGDYAELKTLKSLADELGITLLLVHHLRKTGDHDPLNKLSGSTGITGAVDAVFVLEKDSRSENLATLFASGRDIRDRKMRFEFNRDNCVWELVADSFVKPEIVLPDEMIALSEYIKSVGEYGGRNTDLADIISAKLGHSIDPKGLKQMMNKHRFMLESFGIFFVSKRSNGIKYVNLKFIPPLGDSAPSASSFTAAEICDPCVPAESRIESEVIR